MLLWIRTELSVTSGGLRGLRVQDPEFMWQNLSVHDQEYPVSDQLVTKSQRWKGQEKQFQKIPFLSRGRIGQRFRAELATPHTRSVVLLLIRQGAAAAGLTEAFKKAHEEQSSGKRLISEGSIHAPLDRPATQTQGGRVGECRSEKEQGTAS